MLLTDSEKLCSENVKYKDTRSILLFHDYKLGEYQKYPIRIVNAAVFLYLITFLKTF